MRVHTIHDKQYRLPDHLNPFQEEMYLHTIDWKWAHISTEPGYYTHQGVDIPYDAILPRAMAERQEWPHLYSTARTHLEQHRQRNPFRIHPHFNHMVSSQACFSVVKHPRNHSLNKTLEDYRRLTGERPGFSVLNSSGILAAAAACQDEALDAWADWYRGLYNV